MINVDDDMSLYKGWLPQIGGQYLVFGKVLWLGIGFRGLGPQSPPPVPTTFLYAFTFVALVLLELQNLVDMILLCAISSFSKIHIE